MTPVPAEVERSIKNAVESEEASLGGSRGPSLGDILSDAKISGSRSILRAKDMILDGSVNGEQGLDLEWIHYDPDSFRGTLSTQGQCSIRGNIGNAQALDLISSGKNRQITMNAIAVETSQDIVMNRDVDVSHGISLTAPAIQVQEDRKIKSQKGAIQLKANVGSIEMQEGSELYADDQVLLDAAGDILTKAVKVKGSSIQLKASGNVMDQAQFIDSHTVTEAPGVREERRERKAQVSQFQASGNMSVKAQNIGFQGTRVEAGSIQLEAQDKIAIMGVQEGYSTTRTTEEETGWWFWKGKKVETQSESNTQFIGAQLKARNNISMKSKEVTLQAPELEARETTIDAQKGNVLQGKTSSARSVYKKSENAFWISADSQEENHDTFTQAKIKGKVKLNAKKIELEQVQGQVLDYIDHLEFDYAQVETVYNLLEEFHHREEKSISAPGPALIVAVAVAMSVATAGTGGAAVAGLGMKAASLAGTVSSAAISSLTAQMATQVVLGVLAQQSPADILDKITQPDTWKNVATSAVTAGALYELRGVQTAANASDTLILVENAATQAGVRMGASLAFGEQNLEDALKSAGVHFASQTLGGAIANQIGESYAGKEGIVARGLHKVAHGVSAAATASAAGAMTSEIVAEILAEPLEQDVLDEVKKQQADRGRPLTPDEVKTIFDEKVEDIAQIAKLTGAISGLVTGQAEGVAAASSSSNTAIENNFLAAAMPSMWAAVGPTLIKAAAGTVFVGSAAVVGGALHEASNAEPATAPVEKNKGRTSDSGGHSRAVKDRADEISKKIGKNSVTVDTPDSRVRVDLAGKKHFDKATGKSIETPHVKTYKKHANPNDPSKVRYRDGGTRPATHQDIRTVEKIIKGRK